MRPEDMINRHNPARKSPLKFHELTKEKQRDCRDTRDILYANGWGISVSQLSKHIQAVTKFRTQSGVEPDQKIIETFARTVGAQPTPAD